MYLKRLEIQGFKSFANRTVLEFEKGIIAVVGPNGSGKSNIADSIRWVLGEQSLKQLRGKKSEDVIFAGSEKKSRLSFAEVSVTFDNEDRKIPLDYSEVSITRRIDRSGESDYLINGNKVRLLDIVDLVLKSNIGTSRYTVIGQGTIDQMILAGPPEIKNLIDEASGVKTYYIRRERTLKRLEQSAQNLMRVKDLLAEIEPRLKSLRRQAKKMEERASLEEELKVFQKEFYAHKYWLLEDALLNIKSRLEVIYSERQKLETEIEGNRSAIDKSESENKNEIQAYQQVQSEIKRLGEKKNKLVEDISLIRGKLQAEKTVGIGDGKSLDLEKNNLQASKEHLLAEISKTKSEAVDIDKQLEEYRRLFAEVSVKLNEIQRSLDDPESINFNELAEDVNDLDRRFNEFYENIKDANDVFQIIGHADQFRASFNNFKQKTIKFSQNPLLNFEKQRKLLQEILIQKDRITQDLNRLDLQKSKVSINLDYLEKELSKTDQRLLQVNLELQQVSAQNIDEYYKQLLSQEQALNKEILQLSAEISVLENKISEYHSVEQQRKQYILDAERSYRLKQDQLSKMKDQESLVQIEKAKIDTQKDTLLVETARALGQDGIAEIQAQKPVESSRHNNLEEKIQRLKNQLDMIGGIDELTLKEYQETEQRYTYLNSQIEDLQKGMDDLKKVIEELDAHIKKGFNNSFDNINDKFQNYFRILFNGGRAYLSVVRAAGDGSAEDAENSENSENQPADNIAGAEKLRPEEKIIKKYEHGTDDIIGIDIKATPPGKKLSSISALSGGERSLTSIALLCALLSCFPSPFVMLDEVDAALDEANTIRFAQILGTLAHNTQFITVTHNRETMREANILYGVTMGEDSVSKLLSLKLDQAQAYAK